MKNYRQVAALIEQDINSDMIQVLTGVDKDSLELIISNIEIEKRMQSAGFDRYIERQEALEKQGKTMETDAVMNKIHKMLKPMIHEMESIVDNYKGKRKAIVVETFKNFDIPSLALYTLRTCMMSITGDRLELTAMATRLTSYFAPEYTPAESVRVGARLIKILCDNSEGCFALTKKGKGPHAVHMLEPTEEFMEWEELHREEMAEMSVIFRPLVVPPQPWTAIDKGGFWDSKLQKKFIRNNPKATNRTHGPKVMPKVYNAVNKIQATPFTINQFVLDTANQLQDICDDYTSDVDRDLDVVPMAFSPKFLQTLPERPIKTHVSSLKKQQETLEVKLGITKEVRTEKGQGFGKWVRELLENITDGDEYKTKQELEAVRFDIMQIIKWQKEVTSRKSKNRVITTAIQVANEYRNYPALYFPANLDWRGRVYPMTAGLTTQGNCLQKALIKFAQGKPIGTEEALYWLMVHTANCYGKDKASWQDRLEWTLANRELIERVAQDPVGNLEDWRSTDDPWLFLAACEQMAKYYKDGLNAVVDISIPMDGTCNGCQHYSAMARDTGGAFQVNVAPAGTEGLRDRLAVLRDKTDTVAFVPKNTYLTIEMNRKMKGLIKME